MRVDLHIHSLYSDGSSSPQEIFFSARKRGLACISLTDHDNLDAYTKEDIPELSRKYQVECIRGVELSALFEGLDIHILGYGIDPQNPGLTAKLQEKKEFRKERLIKIANKLGDLGVSVDIEELNRRIAGKAASRLHLAQYLQDNSLVQDIREAFQRYLGKDSPAYIPSYRDSAKAVIKSIKESGGLSFIAHPLKSQLKDNQLRSLVGIGLDGIEALSSGCPALVVEKYEAMAAMYGLLLSGGSDYHGEEREDSALGTVKVPYAWAENIKKRLKIGDR